MKNKIKLTALTILLLLPTTVFAWQWADLWRTPNQQGATLLKAGNAKAAAQVFENKDWRAVAQYRSEDYAKAFQQFNGKNTSDDQYNAGNAAAQLGNYEGAIKAYDKALALNSNNTDASMNREVVKKLLAEKKQQQDSDNSKDDKKDSKDNKQDAKGNNSKDKQQQAKDDKSKDQQKDAQADKKQDPKDKDANPTSQDSAQKNNDSKPNPQANKQTQPNSEQQGASPQSNDVTPEQANNNPSDNHYQPQKENNNQLLRRLADDPGGLLRQKFLRDYYRRHGANVDQGDS